MLNYAILIHRKIGPGALESVYEAILCRMLQRHGLQVGRQIAVPFEFDGMLFDEGFRLDLLVEQRVIVEVKSQLRVLPVHLMQVNTYLKLSNLTLGLLLNFGEPRLKDGIHRIVNKLPSGDSPILRVNRPHV
ncbi:MAG: GxxExxY protein [Gemmatimonadaceae bacterium]